MKVEALQQSIAAELNAKLLGKMVEVLVEGKKKGKWQGRTRTDKLVFFEDSADHLGQLVKVNIEHTSPWALQGKLT
jgi:tRNA-2-methylthio-N6-dimethylallyladenosine synthase